MHIFDIKANPLTLDFEDRALEKDFLAEYFRHNLNFWRVCHLLSILFYASFAIWDSLFIAPERTFIWAMVTGGVTLLFLSGLGLSYFNIDFLRKIWQPQFALYVLATGVGITIVTSWSDSNYFILDFGTIYCLIFNYAVIRIRFSWATLAGWAIVLIHLTCLVIYHSLNIQMLATTAFILSGVSFLGMFISYTLELSSRRNYLLSEKLLAAQEEMRDINLSLEKKVTERTQELSAANLALKASEERYRIIAENSMDSIWSMDSGFRFTYMSPSTERLFGYSLKEWETLKWDDFIDPDQLETVQAMYEDMRNDPKAKGAGATIKVRHKQGKPMWVEFIASPIIGPEGQFAGVAGVTRDATQRKQAEMELIKSEERFKVLSEDSPMGISLIDPQGVYEYVNPAFEQLFGYTLDDIKTGQDWFNLAFPDAGYRKKVIETWSHDSKHYPQGVYRSRIFDVHCKDGSVKTVKFRPVTTSFLGQFVLYEDITERTKFQKDLQESEQKYRQIIQASPMGIHLYELDHNDHLILVGSNPAADQILGLQHQRFLGKTIEEVFPSLDKTEVLQRYREVASQGREWHTELFNYSDNKISGAFEVHAFQTAAGRVTVLFRDITERKQAEQEKEKLEALLRQAQKMEAIGTLAGGIAHDFNNILTAILGYGELARLRALDGGDLGSQIDYIVGAAERARDLVKQLLTYSRRSEVDLKEIDLNRLISQSAVMLEHTIPKMVDIKMKLGRDLWSVRGDANQLEQVIMNLASNASDAMLEGGELSFETSSVVVDREHAEQHLDMPAGDYVLLSVTDTGHGMSKETVEMIFDPFFTTKEIGKGTGLGLSTTYGIIKEHGGQIACSSEPGTGTTFQIYLPAFRRGKGAVESEESSFETLPGGNESILLVDDEEVIRQFGTELLRSQGYRVVTASKGEEAVEYFQDHIEEVDLVILDLGMPGMGGHGCLKALLAIKPDIKVLIASGYSANGKIEGMLSEGAAAYIAKPFKRADILKLVRRVLDA